MEQQSDTCQVLAVDSAKVAEVAAVMHSGESLVRMAELFKALGDATRVRILHALSFSELCVCDLACLLNMSSSAVSHQLRLLRGQRIVKYRKAGKNVIYSLDDQHVVDLLHLGLEHVNE